MGDGKRPRKRGRKDGQYAQARRFGKMLAFLRARRHVGVTYAELAEGFDITVRQLRRDLEIFEELGHEIATLDDGPPRRIALADPEVRPISLTLGDRIALIAARRVIGALDGSWLAEQAEAFYGKILEAMPPLERRKIAEWEKAFLYVADGGVKAYAHKAEIVETILTSLLHRNPVEYRYRTAEGNEIQGRLEPFTLVLFRQGLYVVGCAVRRDRPRRETVVFALERFEEADRLRRERFDPDPDFDPETYFQGAFGLYLESARTEPHRVVIELGKAVAQRAARKWHRSQTLADLDGGGIRLEFRLQSLREVVPWMFKWGEHAVALEPDELRKAVVDRAEEVLGRHR